MESSSIFPEWSQSISMFLLGADVSDFEEGEIRKLKIQGKFKDWDKKVLKTPKEELRHLDLGMDNNRKLYLFKYDHWEKV